MTDTKQQKASEEPSTLTGWLRQVTIRPVNALAGFLVRLGFSPNALTVLGLLISAASGVLAGLGMTFYAGLVLAFGAAFDSLDGAVARLSGRVTRFGALLDSTLDRYGEAFLLAGLGYHLAQSDRPVGLLLVFATLTGSIMVSYVRARSEGLRIDNKVGILTRVERVILLILALLTGQVLIGLWVLAIGTQVTVLQRLWHAARAARMEPPPSVNG
ncbi:MAG: CDP-alcohol phosphatidyltransferase family protein [Anaerolineae bacterium]